MISTRLDVSLTLPKGHPRTPGLHVSSLIRCIAAETGILKPEWVEDLSLVDVREITDFTQVLRILIGLAWEVMYADTIKDSVLDHPGEVCVDGVYMTPDGESVSVVRVENGVEIYDVVVHEYKTTYKSTRTVGDLSTQWIWLAQIKAYCKAKGTRYAQVHCLFLCGDYKFPIKPDFRVWFVEFTQEEIDRNWDLLMDYRQMREQEELETDSNA